MLKVRIFRLPSCLTGGLCVSATAYRRWNGWYCSNSKDGVGQCSKSIEILCHTLWLVNRDCMGLPWWAILSLLNRVAYNSSIPLVKKELGHCLKCCQLVLPLRKSHQQPLLVARKHPETTTRDKLGTPGTPQTWDNPSHDFTTSRDVNHPGPSWDVEWLSHWLMIMIITNESSTDGITLPHLPLPLPPGLLPPLQPRNNTKVSSAFRWHPMHPWQEKI